PSSEKVAGLAPGLRKAARVLEGVAAMAGVLGVLGGIFVAAASHDSTSGLFGDTNTTTTHPYVGLGLAIVAAAVLQALFLWAVARTMAVVAAYALERTEHDRALAAHAVQLRQEQVRTSDRKAARHVSEGRATPTS